MEEVKWLVEKYDEDVLLLIDEIKKQGMHCEVVKSFPYKEDEYNKFKEDDCVVFYGSLNLSHQLQRTKKWIPGPICDFKNFKCSTYYSHWGKYLLNQDYIMLPLLEFYRKREQIYKEFGENGDIFIRPSSGAKTFQGNIFPYNEIEQEMKLMSQYGGKELEDIICIISSPKKIQKEWRIVVAGGEPISASQYKNGDKVEEREGCDVDAWLLAKEIGKEEWQPDVACTLDICKCENKYYLLEANSFSCSGLYKCSVEPIVKKISGLALKEYKEYNEVEI